MMPASIFDPKTLLVNELWLPLVKSGSDQLFPRLKKHKRMKLFTLTDMNYQEIRTFEDNKLTKREDVVAWNQSHQQALRLETELGPSKIFCEGRFDDAINEESEVLSSHFPCNILNLDFSSQNPILNSNGRIEKEINGGNVLVRLLNDLLSNGFIFLYTTFLDQSDLSLDSLTFSLSTQQSFSNPAHCISDKVEFIRSAVFAIMDNNRYRANNLKERLIDINNSTNKIFSIGFVSSRSN